MLKLVIMDVDGTLTDGGIYYSESGTEIKRFSTKDGAGILAMEATGSDCMILTGRTSYAVKRRAADLRIRYVYQGVSDKEQFLSDFFKEKGFRKEEILFIGDDLNDIRAMRLCGLSACPADAAEEVLEIVDYISHKKGGHGAVRDILFHFLKEEGRYKEAVDKAYGGI